MTVLFFRLNNLRKDMLCKLNCNMNMCKIGVREFEHQSLFYVHLLNPWERYQPSYPHSYGLSSTTTDLLQG